MNIVITLPERLIKAIWEGRKKYEVRTKRPKKPIEKVFIIQKGTGLIVGSFAFDGWIWSNAVGSLWADYGKHFAVSYEWYRDYALKHQSLFLWKIKNPKKFAVPVKAELLGIKPPQSFVYTDFDTAGK